MYMRSYDLSWHVVVDDNRRFNRVLLWTIGVTLVLGLLLPVLPVTEKSLLAPPELPKRMAKLLLEPKPKPPPPPEVKLPPKPVEPVKPVERVVQVPVPKPRPVPVEPVKVEPEPVAPRETARERASKAGVMAFADQLADLRQAVPDNSLRNDTRAAATGTGTAQRALVTSANGQTSAGINTSGMSRATGGGGLATRQTTRVTTQAPSGPARSSNRRSDDAGTGGRSREEIEKVFDKNKAAIYALYRRALRSNPALEGKVVLTLTIAPSGDVTDVQIVSSELAAPELEAKLLRRIRLFDFGARDVAVTTTTKPIDFFPA